MAGSNWRVLSPGEQVCAIGFVSDLSPAQIQTRLGRFDGIESFGFLLVEVAGSPVGFMSPDVWLWIHRHRPKA